MRTTFASASLALASTLTWAAPSYQLVDLTPTGASNATALAINPRGQVLISANLDYGATTGLVLWTDGQAQVISNRAYRDNSSYAAIAGLADSGDVMFIDYAADGYSTRMSVWQAGSNTTVQPPFLSAYKGALGGAMGPDGRIVAKAITGYTTKKLYTILLPPQTYTVPVTTCLVTGPAGATATTASPCPKSGVNALNSAGQFGTTYTGFLFTAPGVGTFGNSTIKNLGRLSGNGGVTYALSDNGKAAGDAGTRVAGSSTTNLHAFYYDGSAIADLGTLGGSYSHTKGMNKAGAVVGYALNAAGDLRAFVAHNGAKMQDLNDLVSPQDLQGMRLVMANGINDAGWIACEAVNAQSNGRAVLLKPLP